MKNSALLADKVLFMLKLMYLLYIKTDSNQI